MMDKRPSSYVTITAAETGGAASMPYSEIQSAVQNLHLMTFLKLMLAAGADTISYSQQLEELESFRQELKKQADSFSLALGEMQTTPPKNLPEQQLQQYNIACNEMLAAHRDTLNKLSVIEQEILFCTDYNDDKQLRFKQRMAEYYDQINQMINTKIDTVMEFLKSRQVSFVSSEESVKASLKSAFFHPELQEAYIRAAAGQQGSQGFTAKLKGLFSRNTETKTPAEIEAELFARLLKEHAQTEISPDVLSLLTTSLESLELAAKEKEVYQKAEEFVKTYQAETTQFMSSRLETLQKDEQKLVESFQLTLKQFQRTAPAEIMHRYPQISVPEQSSP